MIPKLIRIMAAMLTLCTLGLCTGCGGRPQTANPPTADADALRRLFLAGADEVTVTADSVTFPDAVGISQTIAIHPARTVSLHTSLTTLWYEAGGSVAGCIGSPSAIELYEETIGRDITQDTDTEVLATSAAAKNWSIETILSTNPDLILCATAMSGYSTIEAPARALGIPVIAADYNDFTDYLKWFRVFCHLTGNPALWESVALPALDAVVDSILSVPTENENPPSVLVIFSGSESLQASTSNTTAGAMLSQLHAVNITDTSNSTNAERMEINLEAILAADPDLILVQCHAGETEARAQIADTYGSNPIWQSLTAVQDGNIHYLPKMLFHNKPNSRFAEAYRILAELLYPHQNP